MTPENSTSIPESDIPKTGPLIWAGLAVLTVFTYFFGLTIPLVGPDEPRYAQVAREMFERGDWVTPTLGGHTWFEKPALLYWLEIASYHLLGVNEFAARFGSVLFGLGTVGCVWLIARAATRGSNETANWVALIAATTIGLIVFSKGASFDIILTFPITAALTAFYIYDRGAEKTASLPLFYVFVGVALLAKGLVGIVFPYAIVVFYLLISRRFPSRTFVVSLFWGTMVAAAVSAIWYVPVYIANGWPFVDEFFIQHHFQRYLTNKYFHPQPFYFFWWVLPLMTLPWLPFLFIGLWRSVRQLWQQVSNSEIDADNFAPSHLLLFCISWIAVPLVFFSFSGSKLPGYILPALPPAAMIAGFAVLKFIKGRRGRALAIKALAGGTLLLVVGLSFWVVPGFADGDSVKRLMATADARGYSDSRVVCMHHLVHNAEFYAVGQMVRDQNGELKKLLGPAEVVALAKNENRPLLVLVPKEYETQITNDPEIISERITDNDETVIIAVRPK